MIKARWQGFEVESGENPVSLAVHWGVLKQALIFALLGLPGFGVLGHWLAKWLLKPYEQRVDAPPDAISKIEMAQSPQETNSIADTR